jgi:hypothetical protein
MRGIRFTAVGALVATVLLVGGALPSGAAGGDILGGHGSFEAPTVTFPGTKFLRGSTFDGWIVRNEPVTVTPGMQGIVLPVDGSQFLSLVDPTRTNPPFAPGKVCRAVRTVAGDQYDVQFDAVSFYSTTTFTVQLEDVHATISVPATTLPAVWSTFHATLTAPRSSGAFCITSARHTNLNFPLLDRLTVTDLG